MNEAIVSREPELLQELATSQLENQRYASLIFDLSHPELPAKNSPQHLKMFSLKRGVLYKRPYDKLGWRLVLTNRMFRELFNYEHNLPTGGHFGAQKTYDKIRQHYWMPRLYNSIVKECEKCNLCAMNKVANRIYSDPQLKGVSPIPFGRLELDVQGPFKRSTSGNTCIIVLTDSLSRFTFAKASKSQETPEILRFLQDLFNVYGYPKVIQIDQGTNFMSDMFAEFMNERHVSHYISNAYHPEGQGQVERMNRTIGERVRIFAEQNHRKWDVELPQILFSINNAIHGVTKYTPAYLFLGFSPRSPSDQRFAINKCTSDVHMARAQAYDRLRESQRKTKERLKNAGIQPSYQPGDLVFVRRKAVDLVKGKKLTTPYHGPYLVLEYVRGHVKTISMVESNLGHPNAYNVNLTKPFKGSLSLKQKQVFLDFCKRNGISVMSEVSEREENASLLMEPDKTKAQQPSDVSSSENKNAFLDSIKRRKRAVELMKDVPVLKSNLEERYNLRSRKRINRIVAFPSKISKFSVAVAMHQFLTSNQHHLPLDDLSNQHESKGKKRSRKLINQLNSPHSNTCHWLKPTFRSFKGPVNQVQSPTLLIQSEGERVSALSCHFKVTKGTNGVKDSKRGRSFSLILFAQFLFFKSESSHIVFLHFPSALICEQLIVQLASSLLTLCSYLNCLHSTLIMASIVYKPLPECTPEQLVQELIKSEERERNAFKRLIFEKIAKTMIAEDVFQKKADSLPQPPHGFARWHVYHPKIAAIIKKFLCHLCSQIAKSPIRCSKCSWVYCRECAEFLSALHPLLCLGNELPSKQHFMCFNISCPGGHQPEISSMRPDEDALYQEIYFRCRHVLCYMHGTPDIVFDHEQRCICGPMDWSFDTTLLDNDYGGEYYERYQKANPIDWTQIIAPALRRASFVFYQRDEARKETLRHWLLVNYPNMDRPSLSCYLECSNGWKDGVRQAKYKDGFISEGERILREEFGLPPYVPHPDMVKMNIKPLVPADGSIIHDPETNKYMRAPFKVSESQKKFRPSALDKDTLRLIAETYGPKPTDESVSEPITSAAHLSRYLGPNLKRKAPLSPQPSTGVSSGEPANACVTRPKSIIVVPSRDSAQPFQRPGPPATKRTVHWGELWQQERSASPAPSVASTISSFTSGDGHAASYYRSTEPRPFIRIPVWEELDAQKRLVMENALKRVNVFLGNHTPTVQVASSTRTEEERKDRARKKNFKHVALFRRRPRPKIVGINEDVDRIINDAQARITNERRLVLSLSMICETEVDEDNIHSCVPLWLLMLDHTGRVVYETLIKTTASPLHTLHHGIREDMVAHARPLKVVASQVAQYIAACDVLVGAGLNNHLKVLGFDRPSLERFRSRLRDMTVYYSPRKHSATSMCINALLLFQKAVINPVHPQPQEYAVCAMKMYLFELDRIENMATHSKGLHNLNQYRTCGHPLTEERLRLRLINKVRWPHEWVRLTWPRPLNFPTLESISASPPPPLVEESEPEEEENFYHYPDGEQPPDPLAGLYEDSAPEGTQPSQAIEMDISNLAPQAMESPSVTAADEVQDRQSEVDDQALESQALDLASPEAENEELPHQDSQDEDPQSQEDPVEENDEDSDEEFIRALLYIGPNPALTTTAEEVTSVNIDGPEEEENQ